MAENVTVGPRFKGEPFDKMLRRFRNKVERAGIIADVKKHEYFESPSSVKNRKNQELKRTKINNKRREAKELHRRKISANRWGG